MSATPSSGASSTSGSGQTSATRNASNPPSRNASTPQSPADLFANLLGWLSTTPDTPLAADGTEAGFPGVAGEENTTEPGTGDNPLAALLSWPGAPSFHIEQPSEGQATVSASAGAADAVPAPGESGVPAEAASGTRALAGSAAEESGGLDLQGMTLLDQPEVADAALQASVEAAAGADHPRPSSSHTARADNPAFAARPAHWRSTTTLAQHAASTVQAASPSTTTQIQLGQTAQMRVATGTGVPASRSTLTLDDRFSTASLTEGPSPLAGLQLHGHAGAQGGTDQQPPGGSAFSEALSAEQAENTAGDSEFTLMPETLAEEPVPEEAAPSPHQLRHASLRVGEGSEEAIDIQLALRGEQLNVDFRTDNPEARASLQNSASGTLSDLLQRGGIQLGQVSVGAQSQGQGQERQGQPASRPSPIAASSRRGAAGAGSGDGVRLPERPLPRSDGSRPLDLFV